MWNRPTCAISGCPKYPRRESYKMCAEHWKEYGGGSAATRPAWVTYLMNRYEQERRYRTERQPKLRSLDEMVDSGRIYYEEVTPYTGSHTKRARRRRGGANANRRILRREDTNGNSGTSTKLSTR